MRKIMFRDRYRLTEAVLQDRKTMTRRIVPSQYVPMIEDGLQGAALIEAQRHGDAFREGEIVAIAQRYSDDDVCKHLVNTGTIEDGYIIGILLSSSAGWDNKMFVKANLMPHHIRITDIKVERLQDISDEDCLREGITEFKFSNGTIRYTFACNHGKMYDTPTAAFSALIDKVSGEGTWESNPYVFAYTFELVD